MRQLTWNLGPSGVEDVGLVPTLLRKLQIPEKNQRIFQSDAAALDETKRSDGISLAVRFAISDELSSGRLVTLEGTGLKGTGSWAAMALPVHSQLAATAELLRFITTPRATQAMVRGSGVNLGRFKPAVHVTLWG